MLAEKHRQRVPANRKRIGIPGYLVDGTHSKETDFAD